MGSMSIRVAQQTSPGISKMCMVGVGGIPLRYPLARELRSISKQKRLSDSSDNRLIWYGHREDALLGFARIIQRAWRRYRGRILPAA